MDTCQVCKYEKRRLFVDEDLRSGLEPNVIATRRHFSQSAIRLHAAHLEKTLVAEGIPDVQACEQAPVAPFHVPLFQMVSNPLAMVKQAWTDAKDDQAERQRIVSWLNEQLQSDDMGLP